MLAMHWSRLQNTGPGMPSDSVVVLGSDAQTAGIALVDISAADAGVVATISDVTSVTAATPAEIFFVLECIGDPFLGSIRIAHITFLRGPSSRLRRAAELEAPGG
ncbi:hypothetical protein AEQ27_04285 [Frigoribacterium sp. RIT-PI-h]|nr:hypothetical protein AEQ27_04285 [Frigoribacterium sp. RIT-PI-h]